MGTLALTVFGPNGHHSAAHICRGPAITPDFCSSVRLLLAQVDLSDFSKKQLLQLPAGAWLKWIRKREDGPVLQQDLGASARAQGDANLDVGLGRSGKDHHPLQVEICRSGGDHSNGRRGMKIDDAP